MPAAGSTGGRRSGRFPTVLFWSGVGLAPLAALLLVVGQGALPLQVAAALAVLAVVLIGLSITLRRDGDAIRTEVENLVFDEIDALRDGIRDDISHAARATHRSLADQIVVLNDTVEALRGQVEVMRGQLERATAAQPHPAPHTQHHPAPTVAGHVPGGVLRHTETVQVTRRTMVVDPNDSRRDGTVYGSRQRSSYETPVVADYAVHAPQVPQQRQPGGVPPSLEAGTREESWTEQLLRERQARRDAELQAVDRGGTERPAAHGERTGGGRRRAYDPDDNDDDRVTGLRTTDRWASVRSDDSGGRELRMGERRSSMHEAGDSTELRIEDRWAAVLRDESRRDESHRDESRRDESRRDESRWDDEGRGPGPRRSAASRERQRDWADPNDWGTGESSRSIHDHDHGHHGPGSRDGRGSYDSGRGSYVEDGRATAQWSETSWEESRRDDGGGSRWAEIRRERRGGGSSPAALPAGPSVMPGAPASGGSARSTAAPAEQSSSWTSSWANAGRRGRDDDREERDARHADRPGERSGERQIERIGEREIERSGEWQGDRHSEGSSERQSERRGRRHRDDDDEYGRNGGRDDSRSRMARRLVDFEGDDDRWR
jgi:hypothetical protein